MRTLPKPFVAVRAKADTHGTQKPVRVVLHDTESHDAAGITDIQGVYNFWIGQGLGYGAHFVVDASGNVGQGADCDQVCWHVGNYNGGSVGIEQIGFAAFPARAWKVGHLKQLVKVARLLAWLHQKYGIPLTHMTLAEIRASGGGVCTHADVGAAGIDPSGHTDPGPNYPLKMVLWLANRYVRLGGWSKAQPI